MGKRPRISRSDLPNQERVALLNKFDAAFGAFQRLQERRWLDTRRDRDSQGEVLYQPGKLGDRPAVVREFLCGLREKEGDVLR